MPQSQTLIRGWRIWTLLVIFVIGAAYIGARLFQLQVLEQTAMAQKVEDNITKTDQILPNRGTIRDARGFLLAGDAQAADLYLDKTRRSDGDLRNIADLLAPIITESPEDLYQRIQGLTYTTMLLARRLDDES